MHFKSVQMLLLLLYACVNMGMSSITHDEVMLRYGDQFVLKLPTNTETVEFTPLYTEQPVVLWRQNDPATGKGKHEYIIQNGMVKGHKWMIEKVTQEDSGHYTASGNQFIQTKILKVLAHGWSYDMMVGEDLKISFDLHPKSCYLSFSPKDNDDSYELVIAGVVQDNDLFPDISLQSYLPTFNFLIRNLQPSNTGRFELKDQNGNVAVAVYLQVIAQSTRSTLEFYIGVAAAVAFMVWLCRVWLCPCLVKTCHSRTTHHPAPPEQGDGPATPSFQRCSQPDVPSTPVPASGGQATRPSTPSLPLGDDFLSSDPGPRFELKGVTFGSGSTHCDVYTSDKLNFPTSPKQP